MKSYSGNISNALSEKNSFLTFPKSCFRPIDFSQRLLDEEYLTETSCDMLVVFWKKYRFCKDIPNSESLLAAPACLQIKVIEQIEFPPKKTKLQKKEHNHYYNYQISQLSQRGSNVPGERPPYIHPVLTDIRYAKGTKDTSTDSSTVAERHTF